MPDQPVTPSDAGPGAVTVSVTAASMHELLEAGQAMAVALECEEVYLSAPLVERWARILGLVRGVVGYRS